MKPVSEHLYQRAIKRIPMATQTSSKAAFRFADGVGPKFLKCGHGARVVDADGDTYLDWTMGLGAVTLGYNNAEVSQSVADAVDDGNLLTLPTDYEVELAELLCGMIPEMEQVRFLKSGSDATSAAVRLARIFTGRDIIVRCGYHGWHDWALNADYAECAGVPQCVRDLTVSVPFNDLEALEDELIGVGRNGLAPAAFILEPVSHQKPHNWYLPRVRDLCTRYGVVLIFDETITGIRQALGGAQEYYGVTADLVTYGKGLANGHALSCVGGRADIMAGFLQTHISGTFYGEMGPLAAAISTIGELQKNDFWRHQRDIGERLISGYHNAVMRYGLIGHTQIKGAPHWSTITWDDAAEGTLFQQEMLDRGILFSGSQFPSLAHSVSDAEETVWCYGAALEVVADSSAKGVVAESLRCAVNRPVFVKR